MKIAGLIAGCERRRREPRGYSNALVGNNGSTVWNHVVDGGAAWISVAQLYRATKSRMRLHMLRLQ